MKRILLLTCLALSLFLTSTLLAQPSNNNCSGAIQLTPNGGASQFTISNSTKSSISFNGEDKPVISDVYFFFNGPNDADYSKVFYLLVEDVNLNAPSYTGSKTIMHSDLGADIFTNSCSSPIYKKSIWDDGLNPQKTYLPQGNFYLDSTDKGKPVYIRISAVQYRKTGNFKISISYNKKNSNNNNNGNNGNNNGNSFSFSIPSSIDVNWDVKNWKFDVTSNDSKCTWAGKLTKGNTGNFINATTGSGNGTLNGFFLNTNSSYTDVKELEAEVLDCKKTKHRIIIRQLPQPEPIHILFIEDFAFYSRYSSDVNNIYELSGEVIAINWKSFGGKNNIPKTRPTGTVLSFPQGVKVNLNNNYIGSLSSNAEIKIKEIAGKDYNLFYFLPSYWSFKVEGNELKPFFTTTVNAAVSYMNFNTQFNTALLTKYKPDESIAGITYTGGFDLVDFFRKPFVNHDTLSRVNIKFSGYNYYREGRCFTFGLGGKYVYSKKFEIELSANYSCNLRLFQGTGNLTLPHRKFGDITANAELEKNKLTKFGIIVKPVRGIKAFTPYTEFYQVGFEYEFNPSGHIKFDGAIRPISALGFKTEKLANISANFKYSFGSSFSFGSNLNIMGHNIGLTNFKSNFSTLETNLALNINKKLSLDLGLNIGSSFVLGGSAGFEVFGRDFTLGKGFLNLNSDRFLGSAYNKLAGLYGYVSLEYGMQSNEVALDFKKGFYSSKPYFAEVVDENLKKYFGIASTSTLFNDYNRYFAFNENKRKSGPNVEVENDEYHSGNDDFSYIFTIDKPTPQLKIKLSNTINGSILKDNLELKKFNSNEILLFKPALGTYILKSDQKVTVDFEHFYDIPSIIIKNTTIANDKISIDFQASAPNQNAFLQFYLSEKKENETGLLFADSVSVSYKNIVIDVSEFNPSKYYIYAKIIGDISSNSTIFDKPIYIAEINPKITKNFEVYNDNDTLKLSFENDTNDILNYYQLFVNEDSAMLFSNTSNTFGIGYSDTFNFFDPELLPLGKKYYFGVTVVDSFGKFTNRSSIKGLNFVSKNKKNTPFFKNLKSKYSIEPEKVLKIKLDAYDLDNDALTMSIENSDVLPSNLNIIGKEIIFNPSQDDIGFYKVVLKISDGKNYSIEEISISVLNESAYNPQLDFNKPYYFNKEIASFYVMYPNINVDSLNLKIYTTKDKVGVDLFAKREAFNSNYFVNNIDLKKLKLLQSDTIFIKFIENGVEFIDFAHYQEPNLDFNFKDSICSGSETFLFNTSKGQFKNYKWYLDGKFIGNDYHLFNIETPLKYGEGVSTIEVKLVAYNDFKDSIEVSKNMTLFNLPIAFPKKYAACISKPSEISPVFKTNGISQLNWMSLDSNVKVSKNTIYLKAKDTTYHIVYKIIDNLGCTNYDTIKIIGVYHPITNFLSQNTACENEVLNFKNTTKTSSPLGFNSMWQTDNTIFSKNLNANISYKTYGEKLVLLIASTAVGCEDTATKKIMINPNPIPKFSIIANKNFCENDTFSFIDISNPVLGKIIQSEFSANNFVLFGNEVKTNFEKHGNFKLILRTTNTFGCSANISDTLRIYSLPKIKLYYFRTDSCENTNQNKIWSVVSTPDNQKIIKKHWNFKTSTMDSIKLHFKNHGTNTVYFSTETENYCTSNDSIKIEIYPQGVPQFDVKDVCLNEISEFKNDSYDANFNRFFWEIENEIFETKDVKYSFKSVGKKDFKLNTITDKGCKNEKQSQTEVFSLPKAKLIYLKVDTLFSDYTSSIYSFTAASSRYAVKYNWIFNNIVFDTTVEFSKYFLDTSVQNVFLVVENNNGCRDTAFLNFIPTPKQILYIPSAFSPNNDAYNDVFIPIGNPYCKSYLLEIFNRWGQKIFESKDRNIGWRAENIIEGVYFYKITFQELDGKWYYYSGNVTILK